MKRAIVWLFLVVGALLGVVWYFNVEQTGGSFADFFSDPIGGLQSLGSRLQLWLGGLVEHIKGSAGGTADGRTIAAGLVAGFEGFVGHVYADPPGQSVTYSIGYGHQLQPGDGFTQDSTISEADALGLLKADLDTYATCVDNAVTVPLSPEQAAALYSLCYNIGCARFLGSTLLHVLNQGDYDGAAAQFAVWNQANHQVVQALVDRRAQEADLFANNPAPGADTTGVNA